MSHCMLFLASFFLVSCFICRSLSSLCALMVGIAVFVRKDRCPLGRVASTSCIGLDGRRLAVAAVAATCGSPRWRRRGRAEAAHLAIFTVFSRQMLIAFD